MGLDFDFINEYVLIGACALLVLICCCVQYCRMRDNESVSEEQILINSENSVVIQFNDSPINASFGDIKCTICSNNYLQGEILRQLACKHRFHRACIDNWFSYRYNCPCCYWKPDRAH